MKRRPWWQSAAGLGGLGLVLVGSWIGLFVAPAERYMGEVQRIMYVHVPSAWVSMVCFTAAFVCAVAGLWSGKQRWDAVTTGAIEVGAVLNALLLVQGSIWARATWGVWWDWDVRLTTSLVMLLLFAGVLALRSFVDDAHRRATWTAVATIVAYVDVPLVYFCTWCSRRPRRSPRRWCCRSGSTLSPSCCWRSGWWPSARNWSSSGCETRR